MAEKTFTVVDSENWWDYLSNSKSKSAVYVTFEFDSIVAAMCWDLQVDKKDQKLLANSNRYVKAWGADLRYVPGNSISLRSKTGTIKVIYNLSNFFRFNSTEEAMQAWGVSTHKELAEALYGSLKDVLGVTPSKWHGPGAVATHFLEINNIEKEYDQEWISGMDHDGTCYPFANSYYGAYVLTPAYGIHHDKVYHYDMNSAFMRAMLDLPKLSESKWTEVQNPTELDPYGNYYVTYDGSGMPPDWIHPLPHRTNFNNEPSIVWGEKTQGWYRGVLVKAAQNYVAKHGGKLTVHKGWEHTDNGERPFSFINDLYAKRLELKETGNPLYHVIKPSMQCIYGKLVMQVGEYKAPYFSLKYAGYITAFVQAAMIDAISQAPEDILSIQTDGVYSKVPLDLPLSDQMGDYKFAEYEGMIIAGNGRTMVMENGEWGTLKYRGVKNPPLTEKQFIDVFSKMPDDNYTVKYKVPMFAGLGTHAGKKELGKTINTTFKLDPWEDDNHSGRIHLEDLCPACLEGKLPNEALHTRINKIARDYPSQDHIVKRYYNYN